MAHTAHAKTLHGRRGRSITRADDDGTVSMNAFARLSSARCTAQTSSTTTVLRIERRPNRIGAMHRRKVMQEFLKYCRLGHGSILVMRRTASAPTV